MTDSSQIKESEISVNTEDAQEKNNMEKPHAGGGAQDNQKNEKNKGGTVGGETPRLNEEVKSTLLFAATSIVAGYISFLLTPAKAVPPAPFPLTSLLLTLVSMAAIYAASSAIVKKLVGKKNMQWIMGNGGAIYLFLWFVTWIIFYNVM